MTAARFIERARAIKADLVHVADAVVDDLGGLGEETARTIDGVAAALEAAERLLDLAIAGCANREFTP